jgi:hypothetical protein
MLYAYRESGDRAHICESLAECEGGRVGHNLWKIRWSIASGYFQKNYNGCDSGELESYDKIPRVESSRPLTGVSTANPQLSDWYAVFFEAGVQGDT